VNRVPTDPDQTAAVFRRMAEESFEPGGSPLYARLARDYADDPGVAEIVSGVGQSWNAPLSLFAGVHLLALSGEEDDPWSRFGEVVRERREFLERFVAEQPIQTNEVQRSWALAPAFLWLSDERPLDLVELGPSAGLNLLWDRYRYRYPAGEWGDPDAPLELTGVAEPGPSAELLSRRPAVRTRIGIDRSPLDLTKDEDALLLQCFVWADQTARLERLWRAIEVARRDPPTLVRGDYREELPRVLAGRPGDGLTVVFHSASTTYLRREERERLAEEIEEAGREGPLAYVAYELPKPAFESAVIDVRVWPGGEPVRLAALDAHGNRMRWLAS
jgi:hypothetical protein